MLCPPRVDYFPLSILNHTFLVRSYAAQMLRKEEALRAAEREFHAAQDALVAAEEARQDAHTAYDGLRVDLEGIKQDLSSAKAVSLSRVGGSCTKREAWLLLCRWVDDQLRSTAIDYYRLPARKPRRTRWRGLPSEMLLRLPPTVS